jgi:voltage-gated potassium channel
MATGTLLWELYEGESRRAVGFRYGLVLFDFITIIFLAVTSFLEGSQFVELVDGPLGSSYLENFLPAYR